MDRLDAARERSAPLELDAAELVERERERWERAVIYLDSWVWLEYGLGGDQRATTYATGLTGQ